MVALIQDEDKCPLHVFQSVSSCHIDFPNFQVNCLSLFSSNSNPLACWYKNLSVEDHKKLLVEDHKNLLVEYHI